MSVEAKLQSEIIKYLKSRGCYVIKSKPGPGMPVGCPDIIFVFEGFWGALEIKASPKAKYQPLQEETLEKLDGWSWARRVDPTDWPSTKLELDIML